MREFWQAKNKSHYLLHNFPLRRYANLLRFVKNWGSYLIWKGGGYRYPEKLEIVLRNGWKIPVTRRTRVEFKLIFLRCDYTWPLPAIDHDISSTIIDLGANVGYFSVFAAAHFPSCEILSVEPFPANIAALRRNVERNHIRNCRIIEAAIDGQKRKVVFGSANIDDPYPTNARIVSGVAADRGHFIECETITLDSLVHEHVNGKIALLKIDIEGSEYDVLYNATDATLKRIERIAIEAEDLDKDRRHSEALSLFLRGKGFRVIEVTPHLLHAWRV